MSFYTGKPINSIKDKMINAYQNAKDNSIDRHFKPTCTLSIGHAFLIDHPESGLILVDTGFSWEQAHEHIRGKWKIEDAGERKTRQRHPSHLT